MLQAEVDTRLADQSETLKITQSSKLDAESKLKHTRETCEELERRVAELQSSLAEQTASASARLQENQILQDQFRETRDQLTDQVQANEQLQNRCETLQQRAESAETEVKDLAALLSQSEEEIERLEHEGVEQVRKFEIMREAKAVSLPSSVQKYPYLCWQ